VPRTALAASIGAALCVLAGCGGEGGPPPAPPPNAIPAGQSIGTGWIGGRVLFHGAPPARRPITMSGEAACRHPGGALSEDVIVNGDGSLRNAVVRVTTGLGDRVFAPPPQPVELDQAGCLFVPHVLLAETSQYVVFKNSDAAVHNVRAVARDNPTFNVSMGAKGRSVRRWFGKPEIVRIKCDIHAWMGAYLVVDPHPFHALTGEDGAFRIEGLPAGTYTLEAWHETLGALQQSVTLPEGGHKDVTFTFLGAGGARGTAIGAAPGAS
jgi:plastocyanin